MFYIDIVTIDDLIACADQYEQEQQLLLELQEHF